MPTVHEQIAIEALRNIAKETSCQECAAYKVAQTALDQIAALDQPTVHHLDASSLDITKSPGGGL